MATHLRPRVKAQHKTVLGEDENDIEVSTLREREKAFYSKVNLAQRAREGSKMPLIPRH